MIKTEHIAKRSVRFEALGSTDGASREFPAPHLRRGAVYLIDAPDYTMYYTGVTRLGIGNRCALAEMSTDA